MNQFLFARSVCEAAGWDPALVGRAIAGIDVPEISTRLRLLEVDSGQQDEILSLARELCIVRLESLENTVRVLTSSVDLLDECAGIWGIGQEWLELIRQARTSILIVAPALDANAATYLRDALIGAYSAGVRLTVIYGSLGERRRIRAALTVIADCFPNANILQWPNTHGFLHAKIICVDRAAIYLGSANLTNYGWNKNVELGVTLRGVAACALVGVCDRLLEAAQSERVTARNGQ